MLKKGPEIDLSKLEVPDFAQDLYYDLKDRHLLPLVAILIVAIVAVPIALSQAGGEEPEPEAIVATPSTAPAQASALVAEAAPGLRDYRRRLDRMEAKNPFKQQYAEEEGGGETGGESGGSTAESPSEVPAGESLPSPESTAPSETTGEPVPGQGKITYFSYAIDVRVTPGGATTEGQRGDAQKATVRRNLPELTMLPSRETPAIVYMGSTKDGKKALMLVSSNVEAIFGDGKCVLGSDSCQLLAMEPGVPEAFVYGGEGRAFKIELLKVHLVTTDKLNRAPLGKPKQKQKSKGAG